MWLLLLLMVVVVAVAVGVLVVDVIAAAAIATAVVTFQQSDVPEDASLWSFCWYRPDKNSSNTRTEQQ